MSQKTRTGRQLYNPAFYVGHADGSARSAARVLPIVQAMVQPASVLDVGCGVGTWLAAWQAQGVTDVLGVDGDYVDRSALLISGDRFEERNVEKPLDLGRRFDLVMTLEVAEHIAAASAPTFVESLVRHGDVVMFSAAVPGQGGTGHINEQWPTYWAGLFEVHGFHPLDILRPAIWGDAEVVHWYRQNLLLFATASAAKRLPSATAANAPLDLVHPGLFVDIVSRTIRKQIGERLRATGVPGRITAGGKKLARQLRSGSR